MLIECYNATQNALNHWNLAEEGKKKLNSLLQVDKMNLGTGLSKELGDKFKLSNHVLNLQMSLTLSLFTLSILP